jgi:predicted O-linked N-acetylglucosamine transferase (SPINDLY family)
MDERITKGRQALASGDRRSAVASFEAVLAEEPDNLAALIPLGRAHMLSSDFVKACEIFTRATQAAPDHAEAWRSLAECLRFRDQLDDALDAISRARSLAPDNPRILAQDVFIAMRACAWDDLEETRANLRDITYKTIARGEPSPMRPFMAATCYDDPMLALAVGRAEAGRLPVRALPASSAERSADKKLTIGYLSAGFGNHPTGQLVRKLFGHHNRKMMNILALDIGRDDGSDLRREIRDSCDGVLDLQTLSDRDAALAIRDAGVDILVDLHGWLQNHRMTIAAHRPAPVQVSWLGFPGTTGAPFFDYLLGDAIVTPGNHQRFFSEKLVRLPGCYQPNDSSPAVTAPPSRQSVGLPDDRLVMASFNVAYKIDPQSFAAWCEVLRQVPGSVLWLLDTNATARRNLQDQATRHGIEADRLIFARFANKADHLARLTLADMALDTGICNGHTTTTDALWAGVPVVTRLGNHFASRVAASLLTAAGMKGQVAANPAAFVDKSVFLANNPERRAVLRNHLISGHSKLPLFDTARLARHLEVAYQAMWDRHRENLPPAAFEIA